MLIEGSQHFGRTLQLANPGHSAACTATAPTAAATATATTAASAATATAAATAASACTNGACCSGDVAGSISASTLCGSLEAEQREASGVRAERLRLRPLGPERRQQEREAGHREQREHQTGRARPWVAPLVVGTTMNL